ncbi:MerR family transcriptional regulator [Streptomyces sp. NPDC002746]
MEHSVGQVAGFAGVTVRTLHHYDAIAMLSPSGRSHAGHRRDNDADLDRLQQILFHRELGFPLDGIAALLDDNCTPEIHRGLGEMYVAEPQFKAFYESMRPGPAEHLHDAINANADRRE